MAASAQRLCPSERHVAPVDHHAVNGLQPEAVFIGQHLQAVAEPRALHRNEGYASIARSFQHVKLVPGMSVLENVALGAHLRGAAGPVAALLRGLGTTSGGGGLADIGTPVAIMLGFAVVMLVVSRLVPDRGVLS